MERKKGRYLTFIAAQLVMYPLSCLVILLANPLCAKNSSYLNGVMENDHHPGFVSVLLATGSKVNLPSAGGSTPLHSGINSRHENSRKIEKIQKLLSAGADANRADDRGGTPLLYALELLQLSDSKETRDNGRAIIRMLLEAGADPNQRVQFEYVEGLKDEINLFEQAREINDPDTIEAFISHGAISATP